MLPRFQLLLESKLYIVMSNYSIYFCDLINAIGMRYGKQHSSGQHVLNDTVDKGDVL